MEWLGQLVAAFGVVAAFWAGNGWTRLRRTGRLRESIAADQLILERLDKREDIHGELAVHINGRVKRLIAEQAEPSEYEKAVRVGVFAIALGLTAFAGTLVQGVGDAPYPVQMVGVLLLVIAGGFLIAVGLSLIVEAIANEKATIPTPAHAPRSHTSQGPDTPSQEQ